MRGQGSNWRRPDCKHKFSANVCFLCALPAIQEPPIPLYWPAWTATFGSVVDDELKPHEVVDCTGEIKIGYAVGWRNWKVYEPAGLLGSLTRDFIWMPGRRVESDIKPEAGNKAGIYANRKQHQAQGQGYESEMCIFGTVALWGLVIVHERGFRAQYAYPLSLAGKHARRSAELYGITVL